MFRNYLKTAFRHLLKSKVNFLFKLGGLTLAMSSLLVIVVYVSFQLSFDRYHKDFENIYRVNARWMENGALASYAIVPPGVGPALKEHFPEIVTFARIGYSTHYQIRYKDKTMRIHGFVNADSTVFDILSFQFIRGDKHSLDHPKSVVLTSSLAEQIFSEEDPMGKTISFADRSDSEFQVTGIIADIPPNSHLHIRGLLPLNALTDGGDLPVDPWEVGIDGSGPLYLRLHGSANVGDFVSKAIHFVRQKLTRGEDDQEKHYEIYLQPIHDIHLDPWINADFTQKGNVMYVYVFSILGIFLLSIAAINYVNLSIADFHKRNKEIAVRKVLGARKKQIAFQVIFETCIICLTSLALSLGIVYVLFPKVTQVLDSNLTFAMLMNPPVTWIVAVITAFLIFISSLYPGWHLAADRPINDLRSFGATRTKSSAGNILLLCQFTISVICICATLVVGQQIQFFQTRDPGYDRDKTLVLFMPDRYPEEKIPAIKNELATVPGVEAVSYSTFLIAGGGYYRDWYRVEIEGEMKPMLLNEVFFDHDFFRAMGVSVVAGRSFDPDNAADPHGAFIVNETAVKEFGWDEPLGKRINYGYEDAEGEKWEGTVVGVVEDYNIYSMRRKIEPLVMRLPWSSWPGNCVYIRIRGSVDEVIARIKKKYSEIMPDFLIDYHLIGDLYSGQYQNEKKAFASLQVGTWIIVLISALGIFSLSAYMSVKRMKEFGVRKVLGATVRQIAVLHVGHFMRIALVANVIALPLAIWMMKIWLSGFAYRTELSGVLFVGVMFLSFLLVILSAGYSSWRAGVMNPIDVIKKE